MDEYKVISINQVIKQLDNAQDNYNYNSYDLYNSSSIVNYTEYAEMKR